MSKKAFWDTNLLLYWIEQTDPWIERVKALAKWQEKQNIETICSSFSLAEILVRPVSSGNDKLVRRYSEILTEMGALSFGPKEALAFALIRAEHKDLKPSDCLQLAFAVAHGVDYFFTCDKRLCRLKVDGIGEIIHLKTWFEENKKK